MVTSETVPFSKSGGLADVVGALSTALAKSKDNKIKVLMPLYSFIEAKSFKKGISFSVEMEGCSEEAVVYTKTVDKVEYVGIANRMFTERKGIYGDTSFAPYPDNSYRFLFFAKCALSYLEESSFKADIVHCHDWTAGFVPYLIKKAKYPAKSIFTIHNLAYQGEFSRFDILRTGIEPKAKMFSGKGLEKRLNMLKTGLEYADAITTVSETYAEEIQGKEQGCGLDELLRSRKNNLSGIINGIDTKEWNPEEDEYFSEHFTASDLSGKAKLKAKLQMQYGLEVNPDIPLVAMITRIAEQKGFPELLDGENALEKLVKENICQFIIIGTGNKKYEEKLEELDRRYDNISVNIIFSQEASHRLEGGADLFLMPSRYEPCGLNQLYSLHYGTLPIAHRTGGLADSIIDLDEDPENGTGFLFDEMRGSAIKENVERAVSFIKNDKKKTDLARKRGMKKDFSWAQSGEKYAKLYSNLLGGH